MLTKFYIFHIFSALKIKIRQWKMNGLKHATGNQKINSCFRSFLNNFCFLLLFFLISLPSDGYRDVIYRHLWFSADRSRIEPGHKSQIFNIDVYMGNKH
jgi:hypothetical protein